MDQQATRTKPRSYTEDYKRQVVDLVVTCPPRNGPPVI